MPQPSSSLATLRPELSAAFQEFDLEANRRGYIGHRVLPVTNVAVQSGTFGRIPIEQLLQVRTTQRAPGSGYNRGDWKFETSSYATKENGWEEPIDDREAKMYQHYIDAEMVSTARAFDAVLSNAERRVAAMVFNPTTWTGASLTTGITNEWDDYVNATPINDVNAAVTKVWEGSGLWANALIINRHVFRNLRMCEQVTERIASSGAGSPTKQTDVTPALLAQVFDLDFIIVADGAQNTAAEGKTASISSVWSNEYAMVARIATTNDFREPCLGRTFHWAGDGSEVDGRVESYRDETVRSDIIRVRHDTDELILYKEAAHLLSNVTT